MFWTSSLGRPDHCLRGGGCRLEFNPPTTPFEGTGNESRPADASPPKPTRVLPLVRPAEVPVEPDIGLYLRHMKRWFDLLLGGVLFLIALPILLLLALAIKLDTPGPILYRSIRVGRGGKLFTFYKLRSMVRGAADQRDEIAHLNEVTGPVFKIARDPRITRVGRVLRRLSLDELPQLMNVLTGAMSLVGPRPPIPEEVAQYEPWQLRRLDVVPGITCLWQISGRSRIGFQEWMRLDLEYIRHRSFKLDMKILIRTIPAVLSREGAY